MLPSCWCQVGKGLVLDKAKSDEVEAVIRVGEVEVAVRRTHPPRNGGPTNHREGGNIKLNSCTEFHEVITTLCQGGCVLRLEKSVPYPHLCP